MFDSNLRQILQTINSYQQKLQSYRQLLNQQIQFNIKDLYIRISGNTSQVTAYHLHIFICQMNQQQQQQRNKSGQQQDSDIVDISLIESMIKSYNNCTSMNLSFIEFALIFLSRENRLLAKLTIQRNSLGEIPAYLYNYAKKILQLQAQLHRKLIQFRKNNSILAEKWINQNTKLDQETRQYYFDQAVIVDICRDIEIDQSVVLRYLKTNQNQNIKSQKIQALLTLKNSTKLSQFLKKVTKDKYKNNINNTIKNTPDPFIRPQFHDCLERPKNLQFFSERQVKSIQKHLDRINCQAKNQLNQKISHYRSFVEKQLAVICQGIDDIIRLQQQIELQRIQLSLCTDFYPILFFQTLHKDKKTLLIPSSFQSYLQKLGMKIQLNHLYVIFKRFSTRADGKLSFNQFCSIFDACQPHYSFIEKNRLVRSLQDVDIDTIKQFLKLIKIMVKNELKIQKIKARVQSQMNIRQIFSIFDQDQDGYVSMTDFQVIWKKHLFMSIRNEDLALFWYRMKIPKNNMIKYQNFISQMAPKLPWVDKQTKKMKKQKIKN